MKENKSDSAVSENKLQFSHYAQFSVMGIIVQVVFGGVRVKIK